MERCYLRFFLFSDKSSENADDVSVSKQEEVDNASKKETKSEETQTDKKQVNQFIQKWSF